MAKFEIIIKNFHLVFIKPKLKNVYQTFVFFKLEICGPRPFARDKLSC
jgi:hypothetical protein